MMTSTITTSHDEPILDVCKTAQANPTISLADLQAHFAALEGQLTDRERAIITTWSHWAGYRCKTRKQLTRFQSFLIDTVFGLCDVLADRLTTLTPEGDLLYELVTLWSALEEDETERGEHA
jgi:hypothetical protein